MRRSGPLALLGHVVIVLALGACASAGLTPQQSDRSKEAQHIANETTKLYGVPHVSVFVYEDLGPNIAAGYAGRQGWILLRRSTLEDTRFAPVLPSFPYRGTDQELGLREPPTDPRRP